MRIHMLRSIVQAIGLTAMITGLCGAVFFGCSMALDEMTADDCKAGIQSACEALQR